MRFNTLSAAFVSRSSCDLFTNDSSEVALSDCPCDRKAGFSGFACGFCGGAAGCSAWPNAIPEPARAMITGRHRFSRWARNWSVAVIEPTSSECWAQAQGRGIAFEEIRSKLLSMNVSDSALPKFQHVTITFPPGQEARLRGFYVGVLGFREKPIPKVVKPLGWIWFDTGMLGVE